MVNVVHINLRITRRNDRTALEFMVECTLFFMFIADEPEKATETMQVASRLIRFKHGIHLATIQIEQYETFMLSCKFCKPLFELNTTVDI